MPDFDLDAALLPSATETRAARWELRVVESEINLPGVGPLPEVSWVLDFDATTVARGDFPYDDAAAGETYEQHLQAIQELGEVVLENVLKLDAYRPYPGCASDFWEWSDGIDLYA